MVNLQDAEPHSPEKRQSDIAWSPFDRNAVIERATESGVHAGEAQILADAALEGLRLVTDSRGETMTCERAIDVVRFILRAEFTKLDHSAPPERHGPSVDIERDLVLTIIEHALEQCLPRESSIPKISLREDSVDGRKTMRYEFNQAARDAYFGGKDPYADMTSPMDGGHIAETGPEKDIVTYMFSNVELAVELGKFLSPQDILNLYIASKAFRQSINSFMLSSIRIWIKARCPEAGNIFPFKIYKPHLIPDPRGRSWGDMNSEGDASSTATPEAMRRTRSVPGIRYFQLVAGRDRYCREIVAIMARSGHLMPKTTYETLLRLWLLTDVAVTEHRRAMMRNRKLWRDQDLYNAQLFFVKLGLHFNDPVYGPGSYELLHLILGQRGLYPLWQLLTRRRFTTLAEIAEAKVRYDFEYTAEDWHKCLPNGGKIHGVPLWEVGIGHREGWGKGRQHLMRPDELVPLEAVERGLHLDDHIRHMILWGYFDWETGENIVPTEEDIYISDEEATVAHMDTQSHWKRKHCLKKRWHTLTPEQQRGIQEDEEDERLRAMGWSGADAEDEESEDGDNDPHWSAEDRYSLDDEIDRGSVVPPQPPDHVSTVPGLDDKEGWAEFVTSTLIGAAPDLTDGQKLRAEGFGPWLQSENFDWVSWMREQGHELEPDGEELAS